MQCFTARSISAAFALRSLLQAADSATTSTAFGIAELNLQTTRAMTVADYVPLPVTFNSESSDQIFVPEPPIFTNFMRQLTQHLLTAFTIHHPGSYEFLMEDLPGFYWIVVGFADWEQHLRTGAYVAPGSEDGSLQSSRGSYWFGNLHIYPAFALQMLLYLMRAEKFGTTFRGPRGFILLGLRFTYKQLFNYFVANKLVVFSRHMSDNTLALTKAFGDDCCSFSKSIVLHFGFDLTTVLKTYLLCEGNNPLSEYQLFFNIGTNFEHVAEVCVQALVKTYGETKVREILARAPRSVLRRFNPLVVHHDLQTKGVSTAFSVSSASSAASTLSSDAVPSATPLPGFFFAGLASTGPSTGPSAVALPGPASTTSTDLAAAGFTLLDAAGTWPSASMASAVQPSQELLPRASQASMRPSGPPCDQDLDYFKYVASCPLPFGAHAGKTHLEVYNHFRDYVLWALEVQDLSKELKRFVNFCLFMNNHPG
jgi:hypothetical protein